MNTTGWATYGAVALGGAMGACLRFWVGQRLPPGWGTLCVNWLGCFAIGLLAAWLEARGGYWRAWGVTGLLGALTTYSSFALETWMLWSSSGALAVLNIGLNLVGCLAFAGLGLYLARAL